MSSLTASNQGAIRLDALTSLSKIVVETRAGGLLDTPQLDTLAFVNLTVDGDGSIDVGQLANIDNSVVHVTGGANLSLPVASYSAALSPGNKTLFSADGEDSRIEFPNLVTLDDAWDDASGSAQKHLIQATGGGVIDLGQLTQIEDPVREEDGLEVVQQSGGLVIRHDFDVAMDSLLAGTHDDALVVEWTVTNQSSFEIGGKWTDNVYLSSDPIWDSGDQLRRSL
jgi:hypothetical protein